MTTLAINPTSSIGIGYTEEEIRELKRKHPDNPELVNLLAIAQVIDECVPFSKNYVRATPVPYAEDLEEAAFILGEYSPGDIGFIVTSEQ